jgi:hypothetical protein
MCFQKDEYRDPDQYKPVPYKAPDAPEWQPPLPYIFSAGPVFDIDQAGKVSPPTMIGSFIPTEATDKADEQTAPGKRFVSLTEALAFPLGNVFELWTEQAAHELPPAEALRTVMLALLVPLGGMIGTRADIERLVDDWIENAVTSPDPVTTREAFAYMRGLLFGLRIGQLQAASRILDGGGIGTLAASEVSEAGGLPDFMPARLGPHIGEAESSGVSVVNVFLARSR